VPSGPCSCDVALESRLGSAYNEEAFRYFLAIERERSQGSGRPFLLVLLSVRKQAGIAAIPRGMAARIFSGLWLSVREVDFVGWFRDGHVAGAVLTQGADLLSPGVSRVIAARIVETVRKRLPMEVARHVRVRVLKVRPRSDR
jgi:di/tricarboxylate transporter